ncbi:TetR family transcriptional regulator [bacterium]|nr:TetR family transcriptional regulator [bacterium]
MSKQEQQDWIRARQPEQIEERRRAILATAREMLAERDFRELSLNELARRAGFTKSNLYRYFGSLEEIFLEIYAEETCGWCRGMAEELDGLGPDCGADAVAAGLTRQTLQRSLLLKLMPMLGNVLERNSSEEAILRFKLGMLDDLALLEAALRRVLPELPADAMPLLTLGFHALVAGMAQSCEPNETVQRVMQHPRLQGMRMDVGERLEKAGSALIRGLCNQ